MSGVGSGGGHCSSLPRQVETVSGILLRLANPRSSCSLELYEKDLYCSLVSLLRFVTGAVRPSAFVFTIYPSLFLRRGALCTRDSCVAPLNTTFHLKLAPANGRLSRRAVLLMFGLSGRSRGAIIVLKRSPLLLWHLVFRLGSENEMETESEKGERTLTPHALELALRNYLKAENSA